MAQFLVFLFYLQQTKNKPLRNQIFYFMKTLNLAKPNKTYTIKNFDGKLDGVTRRFFELGFSRGEKVKIVSTSLQNKVCLIEIRGYLLSVRRSLLEKVVIE